MFNGLIREIAQVVSYSQNILRLKANFRPNLGDSIAGNGACCKTGRRYIGCQFFPA